MTGRRRVVLIAGPTASGKSALALAMAREQRASIVNADSMQVYDALRVLTARPSRDDEAAAEHLLYGFVAPTERFSTGQWMASVRRVLDERDGPLIFVGGTGLYFDALLHGFADIPEIDPAVVLDVQQEIQHLDANERLALLGREDAVAAQRLKVVDPQRLTRALAVKRATGRPLSSYQDDPQPGLLDGFAIERLVLDPDRAVLRERIARRFAMMFESGAVAEVQALRALQPDASLPAMKAIGVPEISRWLDGETDQATAIERASIATSQYAKRQRTWFRNRFGDWPRRSV